MALIKPGPLIADVSGDLLGINFVRNTAGIIARKKLQRRKQSTPAQLAQRAKFKLVVTLWRSLTDAQRADWALDATLMPQPNRLGDVRPSSGFQLFLSLNLLAITPAHSFYETHNVAQRTSPPTSLALEFTSPAGPYNVTTEPTPVFPEWHVYFGARSISENPVFHPANWRVIKVEQAPAATDNIATDWISILGAPSKNEVVAVKILRIDVNRYPGSPVFATTTVA